MTVAHTGLSNMACTAGMCISRNKHQVISYRQGSVLFLFAVVSILFYKMAKGIPTSGFPSIEHINRRSARPVINSPEHCPPRNIYLDFGANLANSVYNFRLNSNLTVPGVPFEVYLFEPAPPLAHYTQLFVDAVNDDLLLEDFTRNSGVSDETVFLSDLQLSNLLASTPAWNFSLASVINALRRHGGVSLRAIRDSCCSSAFQKHVNWQSMENLSLYYENKVGYREMHPAIMDWERHVRPLESTRGNMMAMAEISREVVDADIMNLHEATCENMYGTGKASSGNRYVSNLVARRQSKNDANSLMHVQLIPYGVGSSTRHLRMTWYSANYLNGGSNAIGFRATAEGSTNESYRIWIINTIDFIQRIVRPIDYLFIKIDIEGFEYELLLDFIAKNILPLVDEIEVEFHGRFSEVSDAAKHEPTLLRILQHSGIRLHTHA